MASLRPAVSGVYLACYLLAVTLGRQAVLEGSGLALFWPAAGVAALWMLRGTTRGQVLLDAAALMVGTTVMNMVLAVDPVPAVLFGTANLLLGLAVRAYLARRERVSFWWRLGRRLSTPRELVALGAASIVAALASAPAGLLAAQVTTGHLTWTTASAWLVRNACGTFVVAAAAMAFMTAVVRARETHRPTLAFVSEWRRHWAAELAVVATASLVLAVLVFGSSGDLPIGFATIAASTWIGYRFSPAVAGVHTGVFATVAVLCTLAGRGPFGQIDDLAVGSVVVQVFVLVTATIALMLSLGVSERDGLLTRVVESEERSTARAALLDAVMNSMTDGLVVIDAAGEVTMRNPAAHALMGPRLPPGQDGPDDYGIFRPDGTSIAPGDLPHQRALRGEAVPAADVLRIDPATGQQSILSVAALPLLRGTDGDPMAVVVIHDVTSERASRRELQAFAGTVAHDLKSPLSTVGSWAELLGDQLDELGTDVDVEAPRASLRRIETAAERMDQLITDLLAYSQAQSATLRPVPISLTAMVEGIAHDLREAAIGPPPLIEHGPLGQVLADRTLVRQLLRNVIGNAVKYVGSGTVPHVVVSSEAVADMVEVRVTDNGIGIPRTERGHVFDSFYRTSSAGAYPGTGLGLAICARAVERHGGRISATEGPDGAGTTIVFTLPVDPGPSRPSGESAADQREGETTSAEPPPRRTGSETAVR